VSDDPEPWPLKLGREQRRALKQREKEFQAALKAAGRGHGWRYVGGQLFRQDSVWFASVLPFLERERGIAVRFSVKPMALDPLFWDIVGLPENRNLPLSFRANGAWVLHPPHKESLIGPAMPEVVVLAELVVRSADEQLEQSRETRSIEQMLNELMQVSAAVGHERALAICLLILKDDLDRALALCRLSSPPDVLYEGRFASVSADGTISTFVDQAEAWIISKRRSRLRLV
jgi:hypothetical protein